MLDFKIDTTPMGLSVRYADAPRLISKNVQPTMNRIVARLHDYAVRSKMSGRSGTGAALGARTRNLVRSVFHRVELDGQDVVGRLGIDLSKAVYGRAVTQGATIVPKNAQFLTIPVGQALTASGVPRISAREFINLTKGGHKQSGAVGPQTAGWGPFTASFVNENYTAIMGVKPSGEIEPVFLLRKRVVLPKNDVLGETLIENRQWITDQLTVTVQQALDDMAS